MKTQKKITNLIYEIYVLCLYIPIYLRLFLYCLKYRQKPTILWKTNPWFPYGGLIEKKTAIMEHFHANEEIFAKFFSQTLTIPIQDTIQQRINKVQIFIKKQKIKYPLILKPDDGIGWIGLYFIEDEQTLTAALKLIKKDYILQEYISRPIELSVFFIKYPTQQGRIWSLTRRYTVKRKDEPELMIPSRKIIYKDESKLITPVLEKRFNVVSDIEWFYFGRFDIRVKDMDTFISTWAWFKIIEVNVGAHSMALHAFDSKYSRIQRYRILFKQIKFALEIAIENQHLSWYPNQNLREFLQGFAHIFKNVSN